MSQAVKGLAELGELSPWAGLRSLIPHYSLHRYS